MSMVLPILLLLTLGGPMPGAPTQPEPAVRRCTIRCADDGRFGNGVLTCWYDEKPACGRRSQECVTSDFRECVPRVTSLGQFDPVRDGITDTFAPIAPTQGGW